MLLRSSLGSFFLGLVPAPFDWKVPSRDLFVTAAVLMVQKLRGLVWGWLSSRIQKFPFLNVTLKYVDPRAMGIRYHGFRAASEVFYTSKTANNEIYLDSPWNDKQKPKKGTCPS